MLSLILIIASPVLFLLAHMLPVSRQPGLRRKDIASYAALWLAISSFLGAALLIATGVSVP